MSLQQEEQVVSVGGNGKASSLSVNVLILQDDCHSGRAVAGVLRIYLVRIVHEGCLGVCIKVRSILLIARSEIIVLARLQKSNSASLHCCLICCLLGLVGDDRPLHYRFFCYNRLT